MDSIEFQEFLSKNLKIDMAIIRDYFETYNDPFVVAEKLINEENVPPAKLGGIYASYLGFAYVDPNSSVVNEEFVDILGFNFIKEYKTLPLYKFGKAVTVSTSDPKNPYLQDRLEKKLDSIVSFVFCFPHDIQYYLEKHSVK